MPARRRTYLVRLDPWLLGDSAATTGIRTQFFDWLRTTADTEVVQLCGADRVVITSPPERADQIKDLEYVLDVEPHE
ncbi:hypothetical protein ACRS6B_16425 [Nocardia asteroides]